MSIEKPATVIALAADMIFAAKIRGAAQVAAAEVKLARTAESLIASAESEQPALILLDLDTRGLDIGGTIRGLRSAAPDARIVAYVSHTRTDAILSARDAGAQVLARSAFVTQLPVLLGGASL